MTARPRRETRRQLAPFTFGATLAAATLCSGPSQALAQSGSPPVATAVADATRLVDTGRDYKATRLLLPQLGSPAGRAPEVLLLTARAASGWSGWETVVRLLDGETWLDRYAGGTGRALLARARVERGQDAVADARAAAATAPDGQVGARTVVLARAYDRAALLDSAAAAYRRAAALLPAIGDWLALRAAGVTADSATRAALYSRVSLAAAVSRIRWTEALARDRTGDPLGAARLYASLGASLAGLRLRLAAQPDSATRAGIRVALLNLLTTPLPAEESRAGLDILDREFAPLSRHEELIAARRSAAVDRLARAAQGFARAAPLTDADRLTWGSVLARLGRHREAIARFESIDSRELRTRARYLRARSIMQVQTREAGLVALRQVFDAPTGDSATAATAGFLRADLLVDKNDDGAARAAYLEVARRFPNTSHGARAAFQAALIRFIHGEARDAAGEFAALAERPGDRTEATAALYWSGRAAQAAGDSAAARLAWRKVLDRFPGSYYALPAANRLGVPAVAATAAPPPPPDSAALVLLDRGSLLEQVGMRVEARFEYEHLVRRAEGAPAALTTIAAAFAARGLTARAFRLASRSADPAMQRLQFPLPRPAEFLEEAHEAGVDPLLAAALIRQESGFDPAARSGADARGLMQVLPSVGAALARADGVREWDPALLYEAEVNLRFGLAHLAEALRRFPRLEPALAGYNAGTRAAEQWLALPGAKEDPEIYIERIQFVETRDYVRRILRNLATYRALYPGTP